jgi:hypothetical protein
MLEIFVGMIVWLVIILTLAFCLGMFFGTAYIIGRAIKGKGKDRQACMETGAKIIVIGVMASFFGSIVFYVTGDEYLHGKEYRADTAAQALADAQYAEAMRTPKAFPFIPIVTTPTLEALK